MTGTSQNLWGTPPGNIDKRRDFCEKKKRVKTFLKKKIGGKDFFTTNLEKSRIHYSKLSFK